MQMENSPSASTESQTERGWDQNDRVTCLLVGGLMFACLNPWNMGVVTPELFHNPWAQHPLPVSSWPLPYCVADLATMRVRHQLGRTSGQVLDLPSPWPVSDDP